MRFSDRYITKELIHQNSRVEIYIAADSVKSQDVVIKALRTELLNPYEIAKFRQEFAILSGMSHEGVVKVIDYYEGHQVYLVLEYVEGKPLSRFITSSGVEVETFVDIACQILKALEHIHVNNVIHKDINPANILWNPLTKKATIIDFNISEVVSHESQGFCSPNNLQGTLGYISPEQTGRMNRLIDYRTDFYSLGITFYELLTGRRPFEEDDRLKLIHAHIAKIPDAPVDVKPEIPMILSDIIMKLIEKDAAHRYQSEQGIVSDVKYVKKLWDANETDPQFTPGRHDQASKFIMSQDVYGRDDEVETLLSAYSLVQNGGALSMFVSGGSGVGKTTVIQELFKPVTYSEGNFIYGKFDQFKRDIPYSAIIEAFQNFARIVLSEDLEIVQNWKNRILSHIGQSGKLLIDLVPELENIIGVQPDLSELSGVEAQNRFNYVIHKFIQAVGSADHPLVLFIDDLQWIDSASLSLFKMLLEDTELEYVLLVGAYRDNEVNRSHPLKMALHDLESRGIEFDTMHLGNLDEDSVYDLIGDTFKGVESISHLTKAVIDKTDGNAFLVKQMMKRMFIDRIAFYDHESKKWVCDDAELANYEISSSIAEIMSHAFEGISESTLSAISFVACLGRKTSVFNLMKMMGISNEESESALNEAVRHGLMSKSSDGEYGFVHDRIQEAVYESVNESLRQETHGIIANDLIERFKAENNDELLFDIISNLERSEADKFDQDTAVLKTLYLKAGVKALDASAKDRALSYFKKAVSYSSDGWDVDYERTLYIHDKAAESAYLSGEFDYLEQITDVIDRHAQSVEDKANIYGLSIQSFMSQNKHLEGVELALRIIDEFGVSIPLEPTMEDAGIAFQTVGGLISRFDDVNELLDLPMLDDQKLKAVMRILAEIVPIAFNAAPGHLPLVVCKMVEISIEHGNSKHSPFAYSLYALLLCGIIGDIKLGTAFGDLAIDLVNKLDVKSEMAKTYNMVGLHVMHFKDHLDRVTRTLEMAYLKGLETGDHLFAGFAGHGYCINYYFSGNELNRTRRVIENYTHSMENIKQGTQTTFQNAYNQAVVNLIEDVDQPWIFEGDTFDERILIPEIESRRHKTALLVTYFQKMYLAYIFRAYEQAYDYARKVEENLDAGVGLILIPNYFAFDSLIRLKLLEDSSLGLDENEQLMHVHDNQSKLSGWCELGKVNFEHRYLMVEGEIQTRKGDYAKARNAFEKALEIVKDAGYLNEEALYRERIAEFYERTGNAELREHYLEQAYVAYRRWGANNKARLIKKDLDAVGKMLRIDKSILTIQESSTTKDFNAEMDLTSILKASQAIAKEIVYESLLETMLEILIENAGAQQAVIINYLDDGGIVCARKEIDHAMVMREEVKDIKALTLPIQIINYVMNSKKAVLLRSAINDSFFSQDPYIKSNFVESVLCFPVIRQTKIIAAVYIENNLSAGVFTEQRVDVLNLLSTQIAISLKNAMMYRHMEALVKERTLELEKKNNALERLNNQLQVISVTDGLTQLFNRRKLDEILYYERERYLRYGHVFSVILLDIDKFKSVNDTYGHHVGDQVLTGLAELLQASVRAVDAVGRWGGEEFMIICPSTEREQAVVLAESIRTVIEAKRFDQVKSVTSSFGVAEVERNDDIELLIQRVDGLLYKAKENGRNRVES